MKITELHYDSGKNRFIVDTDGPRFFLSYETFQQHDLRRDIEIDAFAESFSAETEKMKAMDYAYLLLARRAVSSHEVRTRLRGRKVSDEIADEVLAVLQEQNLIDDLAYLQAAVQDQIRLKGYGPWRIVSNLQAKGFKKEEILAAYHRFTDSESDTERARTFAEKKWPLIRGKSFLHRKKKLSDQLLRQGFSYDIIAELMDTIRE